MQGSNSYSKFGIKIKINNEIHRILGKYDV